MNDKASSVGQKTDKTVLKQYFLGFQAHKQVQVV